MWHHSIGPPLARLVLSGCIRIEGLHSLQPASLACTHMSMLLALIVTYTYMPVISPVVRHHSIGPSLARLVLSGCICIESSHSLQPASLACMYLSMLLAFLHIAMHTLAISPVMWFYSIGPSLAQLVRLGCIRIEGLHSFLPASLACMHLSMLLAFLDKYAHASRLVCDVVSIH